ncbi:Star-Related Lipid Transfer Protein 7 [Manis pentadactyla]|nr:Star-Related Lipid Transfer Protein 7 [Manis pentadactyla]
MFRDYLLNSSYFVDGENQVCRGVLVSNSGSFTAWTSYKEDDDKGPRPHVSFSWDSSRYLVAYVSKLALPGTMSSGSTLQTSC